MADRPIENPIINSPFDAPTRHFRFDDDGITDQVIEGRRPSAYFMPIPASKKKAGAQQEIIYEEWTKDRLAETKFVNQLRERVGIWRDKGYPHVTGTTRRLLERKLFFCQVEALETTIFLVEAAAKETQGAFFTD